jgi:signal peptidase II
LNPYNFSIITLSIKPFSQLLIGLFFVFIGKPDSLAISILLCMRILNTLPGHLALVFIGIVSDQITKIWAVARLGGPGGYPTGESIPVLGDLLRFTLAYNEGAAFSSKPQAILPWLHPTLFFGLLTLVALCGLAWFYRGLPKGDWLSRLGSALIVSGAIGNLIDRLRIQKVVDFIDADFPDFIMTRWPTFNLADSWVTIGVACVLLGPVVFKSLHAPATAGKNK